MDNEFKTFCKLSNGSVQRMKTVVAHLQIDYKSCWKYMVTIDTTRGPQSEHVGTGSCDLELISKVDGI